LRLQILKKLRTASLNSKIRIYWFL